MGKLINVIPGSRLLISTLPGSALRTLVESLGKPRDVNKRCRAIQQGFSKPYLVNLISKDTHLVFSIYCAVYKIDSAYIFFKESKLFESDLSINNQHGINFSTLKVTFFIYSPPGAPGQFMVWPVICCPSVIGTSPKPYIGMT